MALRTIEVLICESLRPILADLPTGANIPDTEGFRREVLSGLEWWLPGVFEEVYPEWRSLTLDGIYPALARKTGEDEAEILGQCIFISDQTLTPLHLRMQIAPSENEFSWLEVAAGEMGDRGMIRRPYATLNKTFKRLYLLDGIADLIDWVYRVRFGERRR